MQFTILFIHVQDCGAHTSFIATKHNNQLVLLMLNDENDLTYKYKDLLLVYDLRNLYYNKYLCSLKFHT